MDGGTIDVPGATRKRRAGALRENHPVTISERAATSFAVWVRDAPPGGLERLGAIRGRLLVAGVFGAMPRAFKGRAGADVDAVIEWRVRDPSGRASVRALTIRAGRCRVGRRKPVKPDLVIETSTADFLRLAAGVEKGAMLFATGRLRLRGDAGLALRLSLLFLLPAQRQPTG